MSISQFHFLLNEFPPLAQVIPVGPDETAETLWGEGKANPKAALEDNGFLMRRVVLTPRRRY